MKELLITGEIGWDVDADYIRTELKKVEENEALKIVIDSPGGSVFDMVPMYNLIRDFARNHKGRIDTYIQGMAASCASQIALAAHDGNPESKVIVEDNSIFMIHNAWMISLGDHRELEADAVGLSRIDALLKAVYMRKANKSMQEISDMMDDETFMYGQEIVDAGFADEIIKDEPEEEAAEKKNGMLIAAKGAFIAMKETMQKRVENDKEHYRASRAAACAQLDLICNQTTNVSSATSNVSSATSNVSNNKTKPESSGIGLEDSLMTKEEFKAQYLDLYNEIYNEGMEAERVRVQAHIKMACDSGDISAAVEFIDSGVNCGDNTAVAKYHEVFTKNALAKARAQDVVVDTVEPPKVNDGADAEMKAFLMETGLKGAE